jgi:general secretion pathway protein A
MYADFYSMNSLPFENTPDPAFFFASEQHQEALAAIEYTIRMRKGFVLVTGGVGSGKTTVGRTLCDRCGHLASIVQVIHGHRKGVHLLRQVLRVLGLPTDQWTDRSMMLEKLHARLVDQMRRNKPVVLFVDEAQTLSDEALDELRLLSNLDTDTQKIIQVVLIGQPELRTRICNPRLIALRQRIVMAKQLSPLDQKDTNRYINHRLTAASMNPGSVQVEFTPAAMQEIHGVTGGIPRLINITCDHCLLLGMVQKTRTIEPVMVRNVIREIATAFTEEDSEVREYSETFSFVG